MSRDKMKWIGTCIMMMWIVDRIYTSNRRPPEEKRTTHHCDFYPLFILIHRYKILLKVHYTISSIFIITDIFSFRFRHFIIHKAVTSRTLSLTLNYILV